MTRDKARKVVAELRRIAKEAKISVVIPRNIPIRPGKIPVEIDTCFSVFSPRADESEAEIEMHIVKSREPERASYSTVRTESSFCPECNKPVTLLTNGERPQFYICFDCELIAEVGVGRVKPLFYEELPND